MQLGITDTQSRIGHPCQLLATSAKFLISDITRRRDNWTKIQKHFWRIQPRCNDWDKEHEVFLRHKIAKFVRASPSFKEI